MSLRMGTRVGVYEVTGQIGAGSMVYRARDTSLGREVALKVLPEALAGDPDRLARFEREARTLATLNHPLIAQIYGLEQGTEDSNGPRSGRAIVMELVDGDDLAQRIARGPLPVDDALRIARQIAEALAAAHAKGIVHRDLKPANIKVRADGVVKVLDFGLARLSHPDAGGGAEEDASSATITSPLPITTIGAIMGTAAYMSPEQATGQEADRRSDIWAFGVVLYEMLTGRRAFEGADQPAVLRAVIRLDPDWQILPHELSPAIRTLVQGCLVKERGRRVADISTALFVIDQAAGLTAPAPSPPAPSRSLWRRGAAPAGAAIVAAVVVGAGGWLGMRPAAPQPLRVVRFELPTLRPATLSIGGNDRGLAISPDGSRVVYVGNNGTQLLVRALDALGPVAIYTGEPRSPFVSPDGQWIGFVDRNTTLKRVALTGGPAVTLSTLDALGPRGAVWTADDTIILATNDSATGL